MDYSKIPNVFNEAISDLINNLLVSVDNNIFSVLDELVFINSDVLNNKYFISLFTNKFSLVSLSKSLLLGIIIYYSVSYLFSHFTSNNFQRPASFLLKLFISAVLIHFSSYICEYLIDFFSLLTDILRELGIFLFSTKLSFSLIYERIKQLFFTDLSSPFTVFSFDGLTRSFISFGFINLLFTYSVRFVFIKILILISPFAFLSLALDQSQWIFKIWLKNFIGQLFTQLFICAILLIIFSFQTTANPTITKLLYLGSLLCLIKANSFVREFTSGFTSDITSGLSNLKNTFQ